MEDNKQNNIDYHTKYKLIHTITEDEDICVKVIIDEFTYYIADKEPLTFDTYCWDNKNKILVSREEKLKFPDKTYWSVIATDNLNIIGIPKVCIIKEWEVAANNEFRTWSFDESGLQHSYDMFEKGYTAVREKYKFTEQDMIDFTKWKDENYLYFSIDSYVHNNEDSHPPKELFTLSQLLEIWKKSLPEIIYYK